MGRTYLYVPFEERDDVRKLGAQWDSDGKSWFIDSALDAGPFRRWLDEVTEPTNRPYHIESDHAYLLSARIRCWKCHAGIRVFCIYCESGWIDGDLYEQFTVSNITDVDQSLRIQLEGTPEFRFGQARVAGGRYLTNHCERCGTQQADYYLHCESRGVFFRLKNAASTALQSRPLAGRVRLSGDEGFEP